MDIRFQAGGAEKWKADVVLFPVRKGEHVLEACPELDSVAPYLQIAPAMRDVTGRFGELHMVYGHPDLPCSRILFLGLGDEEVTPEILRNAFAKGVRKVRRMNLDSVLVPTFAFKRFGGCIERSVEEVVYASMLANYAYTALKHPKADAETFISWLAVGSDEEFIPDSVREAARRGETAAETVARARDLINAPANVIYPDTFAEKARALAQNLPLTCTVLDEKDLDRLGMNAHLAVAQGGRHAPRLVILEYAPRGHEEDAPVVFVGKGITFDSGGISIKPAANMHTMKCDMTGAAAVLAALAGLATEGAEHRVVGVMALAENMPDAAAVHPGDVVNGLGGVSIEIINTDAEGRLVLCDALSYVQENWKPACVIDVATLTGACEVALGDDVAGLFSNDDDLAERVLSAGGAAGENYWRLPLWAGYRKKLESPVADICHTGSSRAGGAITAALFLEHFIQDGVRWAHLDVAGEDWMESDSAMCPKGARGFAARTLLEFGRGGF